MPYVLGLDISTTGAKAILVDETGKVVASHTVNQTVSQPRPLWSEQSPEDWWSGMLTSIREVVATIDNPAQIEGIGLTGQMHGLVCLDQSGKVLRPAMLWNDQRTQDECDWITETVGPQRLIELTGNRALTGFTAPKIIWVRNHEPDVYAQIAHILLPKDYIRYQLTGNFHTDLAGASGTLLLDVAGRNWSEEVLQTLDIPAEWMRLVHEGTQVTGSVSQAAAQLTGLQEGTPVVGGGGDQAAQAVGVGAIQPGIAALTIGTSGVVFMPLAEYAYEPDGRLHAFCHAMPGQYHFMGVMLSAAGSLQWYRDTLAPDTEFGQLIDEAIGIDSEGLFFLPYLTGERTPHPDPLARGAFVGLTARHTRSHMTRAVLEGVAFGLRDGFELIKKETPVHEVRVSGGGARSELWLQIIANIINHPVLPVETIEGAAYGAALLAGMGSGIWTETQHLIQTGTPIGPDESAANYEQQYEIYRQLYPALTGTFHQLGGELSVE